IRSATSDELPCAMLANGPACIRQGWPSSVWIRLGLSASFNSTDIAPAAPRSSAVTGLPPSKEWATVMAPRRRRRSCRSRETARIAITSEAAVMSKPDSRGYPFARPPWPIVIARKARSFMSTARFQSTRRASILCGFPCRIDASIRAASRLFAAPMAWMSPVKWRFRSSIGTTWASPPPAAPPLMPNTGPSEGSRRQSSGSLPIAPRPWVSDTAVVVLPSPALVGVTPATQTILASGASARRSSTSSDTFALCRPYGSNSSGVSPVRSAIVSIGTSSASCAISRLLFICSPLHCRSMTHRRGRELRNELVLVEALQGEGLDQVWRLPRGRQLGQRLTHDRRRLEPVGAPPRADVEVVDLGLTQDRAVIGRQVAESRPTPQDAGALELREELERVAADLLHEVDRALNPVGGPGLDLGAHEDIAAVRLRDVDVHLRRHDDHV